MIQLIRTLNFLISIYMMIIFARVILTWFSWLRDSQLREILARITDPYINLFRRFTFLRIGYVDLTPMAAIVTLSFVSRFLTMLAFHGRITIGITLALVLQALWGLVSVILGFLIIVLVLRLVAHLMRFSIYSPFWRIVDTISQPVIYRINSAIFKDRIARFTTSAIVSIASLGVIYLILRFLVLLVSGMLIQFPL
jgi:YggT family protein